MKTMMIGGMCLTNGQAKMLLRIGAAEGLPLTDSCRDDRERFTLRTVIRKRLVRQSGRKVRTTGLGNASFRELVARLAGMYDAHRAVR